MRLQVRGTDFKTKLLLFHTRLWDHLGSRLYNHRGCGWRTSCCRYDRRELDGALLELVGELLVQEIANHENHDNSHDVENIEGRLGRNLLNGRAFDVIDDWSAH